jgi:hypothetical protein
LCQQSFACPNHGRRSPSQLWRPSFRSHHTPRRSVTSGYCDVGLPLWFLWIDHTRVKSRRNMASRTSQHERIKATLQESAMPMDVENVRLSVGLKNWESTKAILLEMVLRGEILGQKTTKSWIFWANPDAARSNNPSMHNNQGRLESIPLPRAGQLPAKKNGRR